MGEDMWLKIGTALLIVAMLAMVLPRARVIMKETRKGTAAEWQSVIIPLLLVIGFVVLLIMSV